MLDQKITYSRYCSVFYVPIQHFKEVKSIFLASDAANNDVRNFRFVKKFKNMLD